MAKFTGHTITSDSALGDAKIQRSLRFNDDDSASLNRTPSSASNRKTFTFSCWTKRGNIGGSNKHIFAIQIDSSNQFVIRFVNTDKIQIYDYQSASHQLIFDTNALFRDFSAWYHIVVAVDTTQSTNTNRFKLYVNGSQVTSFSSSTYPSQNHDTLVNTTNAHDIGQKNSALYFDGYLAEFHFIDGYQYDPSYFGFTDPVTNIWMPKRYEGTYGTNGFYLDFSDNSSTSTLGIDKSTNGNDFTASNLAVTDSVKDTPTNVFCTWNPISTISLPDLQEGNLKNMGTNNTACNGTISVTSGKWYWEQYCLTDISSSSSITTAGVTSYETENDGDIEPRLAYTTGRSFYRGGSTGGYYNYKNYNQTSSTEVNSGGTYWGGAVVSFRLDMDAGTLKYYTNNTLVHTDSTIPTDGTRIFPMNSNTNSGVSRYNSIVSNFGQDSSFAGNKTAQGNTDENGIGDFYYAVPKGFKALCRKNLPKPDTIITKPQRHFDVLLWDGDGSASKDVTGLEFKPDLIWIKNRSQASTHSLQDSIIGFGDDKTLRPDTSNALDTNGNLYGYVNHTLPNGFNVNGGSDHGSSRVNSSSSGAKHVAWCWKGGGTAVSNTDGSITTQVSANPTAGFSIVKWTGNQTSGATIGHGLGAAPQAGFFKRYDGTGNWIFPFFDNQVAGKLNNNDSFTNSYYNTFFPSQPNSTTVTIGSNDDINRNTSTYAAYIFTSVEGYCKIGSYTGVQGSGNGNFVHTGFRPAFLIVTNAASEFTLLVDSKRGAYNPIDERLFPGWNYVESDEVVVDFLSNGFKARNDGGANIISGDGSTYLYIAYAEQPGTTPFDTFANAR